MKVAKKIMVSTEELQEMTTFRLEIEDLPSGSNVQGGVAGSRVAVDPIALSAWQERGRQIVAHSFNIDEDDVVLISGGIPPTEDPRDCSWVFEVWKTTDRWGTL